MRYYCLMKKKIITLIIVTLLIVLLTFLPSIVPLTGLVGFFFRIFVYLNIAAVCIIGMIITGIKIDFDTKNIWQYLIGLGIALTISFFAAFLPAMLGHSIVGDHQEFKWDIFLLDFLFFVLFVGPVEELAFRVYYQETFCNFFKNGLKWIGVIIAAFLFGTWHLINGSLFQMVFTFGFGLIFGFAKYFIKNCKYLGLALGHGVYDFLNIVVCMFVI